MMSKIRAFEQGECYEIYAIGTLPMGMNAYASWRIPAQSGGAGLMRVDSIIATCEILKHTDYELIIPGYGTHSPGIDVYCHISAQQGISTVSYTKKLNQSGGANLPDGGVSCRVPFGKEIRFNHFSGLSPELYFFIHNYTGEDIRVTFSALILVTRKLI